MFDAIRKEFHDGLTDLATHTLGVAEMVDGLDSKFEVTVTGLLEKIDDRFKAISAEFDAKLDALKGEMSDGEAVANEAVKALGDKVAEMKSPSA